MRLIIGGARARVGEGQGRGALEIGLRQTHLRGLRRDVALQTLIVLLRRLQGDADLLQIGLGHAQRNLELSGIETEKHLPLRDLLALAHLHRGDDARHIGRHHQFAGAHIGVIGGDHAPATQPEKAAGEGDGRDAAQHENRAQPAAAWGLRFAHDPTASAPSRFSSRRLPFMAARPAMMRFTSSGETPSVSTTLESRR